MKDIELRLLPHEAASIDLIKKVVICELGCMDKDIGAIIIRRKTVDARQKRIFVNLGVRVYGTDERIVRDKFEDIVYQDVSERRSVIIVGMGPAGLFAALRLIEGGMKPIILERGNDVDRRKSDLSRLERQMILDPESNYGYGEGGAGTFSDGKLYTRSKKRGSVEKILRVFCKHSAPEDILIDVHPHIGTDKLPDVIKSMRETILKSGGEVHFGTKMTTILLNGEKVVGCQDQNGEEYKGDVILATGHSARDVYKMLHKKGIQMEQKGIAVGVRVEHPQLLIDEIRYHNPSGRGKYLPAATYTYSTQSKQRGVYSFCMCPGGFVIPASTAPNEQVVNGMSPMSRGSKWANSGMVVEIRPEDLASGDTRMTTPQRPGCEDSDFYQQFPLLQWCEQLEYTSYLFAEKSLQAPAQRMEDFCKGIVSKNFPMTSYKPGLVSVNMNEVLPFFIGDRLNQGFRHFGKINKGFLTNEAILLGVESRTSSPIRIPRSLETMEHPGHPGLYPAGEGAGYAGGIVSAAIDGERIAEAILSKYGL